MSRAGRNSKAIAARSKKRPQKQSLSSEVAALLRGSSGTPAILTEFHRLTRRYPAERFKGLNQFIVRNSFALNPADYGSALRFTEKQLSQLPQIQETRPGAVEDNWLQLATAYIGTNRPRVESWIAFDAKASASLLRQRPETIKSELLELQLVDQQSMFSMRLFAALHAYSDTAIREYLQTNLTSSWFKARLLYPLIYYAINQPTRTALTQMLSHLMPTDGVGQEERRLISFLLCPQEDIEASLSYRCYVGLMGHPYDALEYITHYVEFSLARRRELSSAIKDHVGVLAAMFPSHRIARLHALLAGTQLAVLSHSPDLFNVTDADQVSKEIAQLLDAGRDKPDIKTQYPLIDALRSLRWNLYPVRADYDLIDAYRCQFAMLSAGSFVDWFARSLFLFEREAHALEEVSLFRGVVMCGGLLPLLMMGPCGPFAIDSWSGSVAPGASTVRKAVEATFGAGKKRTDRLWVSVANWSISQHQRGGRLNEWCAEARATFPIWLEPRYLSGLDWQWLADVIAKVGVLPFRAKPNGIYVLFLRQVEASLRESAALRLALEPIVRRGDPDHLFQWLAEQFDQDALAIIRTVLLPDTMLKLRLADNYTAALTARLALLEAGVRRFNFIDGVLSEQDLEREALTLTASLSRMSLGARQFELPWETLKSDAITRVQATYDAYVTMVTAIGENTAMANARRVSTFPFSNGALEDYEGRNRDWPMILTIAGVVDTFLSHPTGGIEAILSVRIRHDAFRRELINSVRDVAAAPIPGVPTSIKQTFVEAAERHLSKEINAWLDKYMHTARKGKEAALFNFVPSRSEMKVLLDRCLLTRSLEEVVDVAFDWIRPKLETHLGRVRQALSDDLSKAMTAALTVVRTEIPVMVQRPFDVARVGDAVSTAVERRLKSLEEWFKVPEAQRDTSLTLQEIYLAVQQRFQPKGSKERVAFGPLPANYRGKVLPPKHIRHMYDLLSELVQNAIKHGGRDVVRVRFSAKNYSDQQMLLISNPTAKPASGRMEIEGHPYENLHASLFGEGNTGCKKIAYLTASIVQRPARTLIEGRHGSFHVAIPLEAA